MMIKQVIVVRKDLNMRRGKSEAQVAYASMKVFFDMMSQETKTIPVFNGGGSYSPMNIKVFSIITSSSSPIVEWINGSFTKVVVSCDGEEELLDLQKQAEKAGIINAIIQDNGQTEFKEDCLECSGIEEETRRYVCMHCNNTGKINKPTYTTLAIGPDEVEKIDKITRRLKLR